MQIKSSSQKQLFLLILMLSHHCGIFTCCFIYSNSYLTSLPSLVYRILFNQSHLILPDMFPKDNSNMSLCLLDINGSPLPIKQNSSSRARQTRPSGPDLHSQPYLPLATHSCTLVQGSLCEVHKPAASASSEN